MPAEVRVLLDSEAIGYEGAPADGHDERIEAACGEHRPRAHDTLILIDEASP